MQDAMTMLRSLLLLIAASLCACGQPAAPKEAQAAESKQQTHAAATSQKGQITQPTVNPGKIADASSLLISFHGCADLLLIDPKGRKLGYDTANQKNYLGIPGGIYDEGDPIGDDEESKPSSGQSGQPEKQPDCIADKTVQLPNPVAGVYTLKMGGQTQTAFRLEITSYGADAKANGHYVMSQPASSAPRVTYQFELPPSSGAEIQVKAVPK
jgi:hypothetical protein